MANIIDSYSESNQDNFLSVAASLDVGVGQSFTGDGETLDSNKFYLRKVGSPTGNIVVKVYAHTGTFGTSSKPTGAALATSDVISAASLSGSFALTTFSFSGANRVVLANGTKYVITLEYSGGDGSNYVDIGTDHSSPTHGGNASEYDGATWVTNADDVNFYVYGVSASSPAAASIQSLQTGLNLLSIK